jgi:outer membrane receptor protein involved in Fe transport
MGLFFLNATWSGRPLVDALRELEHRGLHLIYSSEVIQMEMTVRSEPRATEPRAILDELLREQHLHAVDGPKETLVIVRDTPHAAELPSVAIPVALDQIVVTPSHYGILGGQPEQRQFLSREEVRALPHFSDDVYRAINRIPGAASTDVSANFNIRGGERNEVEVLLDGVPIYEPFHVKDLMGVFSTIDAEALGGVDILTGGFPAEYGGRMSGVIDIASLTPTARRTEVGISLLNSRLLSAGTFSDNRGQWLFSFRPGYLHQVLKMIDKTSGLDPSYYDLLSKVQWQLSDSAVVSLNFFSSQDRLRFDESSEHAVSRSRDDYLWVNARTAITPRLFAQNVIWAARIRRSRDGNADDQGDHIDLHDDRSFDSAALKNDTTFDWTAHQSIKAGFDLRRVRADYDFEAHAIEQQSILHFGTPNIVDRLVRAHPSGTDVSAYVADRITVRPNLIVEAGLRADRQSYTPDGTHFSPRFNVGWSITPSTSLRGAWGRYIQPQGIEELQVEDGVQQFFPAQRSTHVVVGVDHVFSHGWSARVEVYDKRMSHLRPRFENLLDSLALFPEAQADRIRIAPDHGVARGAELLLRKESNGPWSGWISYARSSVRDDVDGRMVPRSWDQRDAVTASVNYGHADRWNISLAGIFHSGWPTTSISPYLVPVGGGNYDLKINTGPLNDDRLPGYARIDLRASRSVPIASGRLSFFVEAINLFNHANVSRVAGFNITADRNLTLTTTRLTESIVPLVPSFGITWQF